MYKFAGQRAQWRLGQELSVKLKLRKKLPRPKNHVRQHWYERVKATYATGKPLPSGMPLWLSIEIRALTRPRWLTLVEAKFRQKLQKKP